MRRSSVILIRMRQRTGLHFVDMFQYIPGRRRGIPPNRVVLTNHGHIEYRLSRPKGIHHNLVLVVKSVEQSPSRGA